LKNNRIKFYSGDFSLFRLQQFARNTRLKVKISFHNEVLHAFDRFFFGSIFFGKPFRLFLLLTWSKVYISRNKID
jgi:hypothetical protein